MTDLKHQPLTLAKLQEEHREWSLQNFGKQPAWHPLLGVVEELGELMFALEGWADNVKKGVVRHPDSYRLPISDAVGDVVIFLSGYCTAMGWELSELAPQSNSLFLDHGSLLHTVGSMCHHHLKMEQGIRNSEPHEDKILESIALILGSLHSICMVAVEHDILGFRASSNPCMMNIVEPIWNEVKKRDWTSERRESGKLDG